MCLPQLSAAIDITVVDQHGNALEHAVVTATSKKNSEQQVTDVIVAQSMQQFLPRVTVVPVGSYIEFPNRDTTQHHVYSFSEAKQFELELYKGESQNPVQFDQAGIVALGCNIHDWMLGYVYVTSDPLFGVTTADGSLSLAVSHQDIDSLTVWHPASVNFQPQSIPVAAFPSDQETFEIVLEASADDPLKFEIDPLQQLFEASDE